MTFSDAFFFLDTLRVNKGLEQLMITESVHEKHLNALHPGENFSSFIFRLLIFFFFKINIFEKLFQDYHLSVKQFGPRSRSKLFAKGISRRHLGGQRVFTCWISFAPVFSFIYC